ncbi:MAG: helix-turn-helix transcriptional regulator [Thermoguttaceae bacterium]
MSEHTGDNLARLMASQGLTVHLVVQRTGVDPRTIRGILRGVNKPHATTLRRLADGLNVTVDEFFVDPARLLYRRFDRRTQPAVTKAIETHDELFHQWTEADFDELHNRLGEGGTSTAEDVAAAARRINEKRELREILDLLLESDQATIVSGMLRLCFRETTERNREGRGEESDARRKTN